MKVIKKINNNVALCVDDNGKEVVAFGKGIGFKTPPYELEKDKVDKLYYNINDAYINLINRTSKEIIDISENIYEYAKFELKEEISPDVVFTLVDHINFAIERYNHNMNLEMPMIYDFQYLFDNEIKIGEKALSLINEKLGVNLPKAEAAYIALHLINAKINSKDSSGKQDEEIINDLTEIIENHFDISIDKKGFNYSRFVTHMYYLLRRVRKNELVNDENKDIYELLVKEYPKIYECCNKINYYFIYNLDGIELTIGEYVYLMLHINRLCVREDCYH